MKERTPHVGSIPDLKFVFEMGTLYPSVHQPLSNVQAMYDGLLSLSGLEIERKSALATACCSRSNEFLLCLSG